MRALNYNHLHYFWVIAHEQSLKKAAERLHVSQSALSIQLRKLEQRLGQALFDRSNRRLTLTEAGRIALDHADSIFRTGQELVGTLNNSRTGARRVLRIGAVATLSRNFQIGLLRPLLDRSDIDLVLRSGSLRELLGQLQAHNVDVVLSNEAVRRDADTGWHSHLLDRQPASLVGRRLAGKRRFRFPGDLRDVPLLLPSLESSLRASFDLLMEQQGIRPLIVAEVDDMAMLRLLARDYHGVSLVPRVVVQDELRDGKLVEHYRLPGVFESFYAITASRRFPNELVRELLARPQAPAAKKPGRPSRAT